MMYQYMCVSPGNIKGGSVHHWSHDSWSIMCYPAEALNLKGRKCWIYSREYIICYYCV